MAGNYNTWGGKNNSWGNKNRKGGSPGGGHNNQELSPLFNALTDGVAIFLLGADGLSIIPETVVRFGILNYMDMM